MINTYIKNDINNNCLNIDFKTNIDFIELQERYYAENCKTIDIWPYHEFENKKINFDFIKYFDDLRMILLRFGFYHFDIESFKKNFPQSMEIMYFFWMDQYNFDLKDFNPLDFSFVDGHPNLKYLGFEGRSRKSKLQLEIKMPKIEKLFINFYNVKNLKIDLSNYPNLRIFETDLPQVLSYFDFSALKNLKFLRLKNKIHNLNNEDEIKNLPPNLEVLELNGFQNTKVFPDLSHLTNLRYLAIDDFKGLEDLSALSQLKSLEFFSFHFRNKDFDLDKLKVLHEIKTLKYIGGIRAARLEDFDIIKSTFHEQFNRSRMDYIIHLDGIGEFSDPNPTGLSYIDGFY